MSAQIMKLNVIWRIRYDVPGSAAGERSAVLSTPAVYQPIRSTSNRKRSFLAQAMCGWGSDVWLKLNRRKNCFRKHLMCQAIESN